MLENLCFWDYDRRMFRSGSGCAGISCARDTEDTASDTDPMMEKITETVDQMARAQSELTGRLDGMAAAQETARGELTRTLTEQLTNVSKPWPTI